MGAPQKYETQKAPTLFQMYILFWTKEEIGGWVFCGYGTKFTGRWNKEMFGKSELSVTHIIF